MKRFSSLFCLSLAVVLSATLFVLAEPTSKAPEEVTSTATLNDPKTEANIARVVAKVLEQNHYSQTKIDDSFSEKFLDRYYETLDGQRLLFLESDLAEFARYRTTLDELIVRKADTSPAHQIFDRLISRVEQRVAYATTLLKTEKFEFKDDDSYTPNRKDLPRPKDMDEAKALWRQHLRLEYLQEKLAKRDKKPSLTLKNIKNKGTKNGDLGIKDTKGSKIELKKPIIDGKEVEPKVASDPTAKKEPELTEHEQIVKALTARYNRMLKSFKDLTPDEVLELYLTSMSHVYDPHSDYMGRAQMENFAISMKLSLFGIGAVLTTEDEYCKIQSLVDGPAKKSKEMKEGDRIVAVAQEGKEAVDCVGMKLNKVVEMIRGEKGTKVLLTILPVDAPSPSVRKVVTLVRDEIKLEDQEAKAKVIDMPGEDGKMIRLGVIDLPSFYEDMRAKSADHKSTSADVAKLLRKLNDEKVHGVILDLRRNGGGALTEAIKLTGLFIKDGPVVQTKDPGGRIEVKSDRDPSILYGGPLIVLTSRFSASASEILAGALQDYGRALVVGDSSTHGKGTVQQLLELREFLNNSRLPYSYDPGALKFTIQKFYRAGGSSTQLKGVVPDIILPSVNNYAEIGESSLDGPLPWDIVSSAKLEKLNQVEPYLTELKKRSTTRIEKDQDFKYVRDDIARYKKTLIDKSLSLNEAHRIKELDELKAIIEARKKERKARKPLDHKIYEVTLKNVEQPGLILAAAKTNETSITEAHIDDPANAIEGEEDDKGPFIDATLEEAKRILADYIGLSAKDFPTVTLAK